MFLDPATEPILGWVPSIRGIFLCVVEPASGGTGFVDTIGGLGPASLPGDVPARQLECR